jgi:hypothetical protein
MPQIVSSETISVTLQIDGRRQVHEVHVDADGQQYCRAWLAEPGEDLDAARAAYAARLAEQDQ